MAFCNSSQHKFQDGKWCCQEIESRKADLSKPGTLNVVYQQGQDKFHNYPTIRQQEKQMHAEAAARGTTLERYRG